MGIWPFQLLPRGRPCGSSAPGPCLLWLACDVGVNWKLRPGVMTAAASLLLPAQPDSPGLSVQITSRVFFGEPGPWFNQLDMDGDKTSVFHDIDGSVSEYPGSYLTKDDNWLLRHPDCIDVPDWRGAICSGHYAQVGIPSPPMSAEFLPSSFLYFLLTQVDFPKSKAECLRDKCSGAQCLDSGRAPGLSGAP